jgi:hypothetical protein
MSTKSEGKSSQSSPHTPTSTTTADADARALNEALDDLDLYNDDDDDLDASYDGGFSSPEQTSPLALNFVGMSKTSDIEVSPFPTLAAREEEDAMGGNVRVMFALPTGTTIAQEFGIGQTVQMLKGWLEKEHDIPYVCVCVCVFGCGWWWCWGVGGGCLVVGGWWFWAVLVRAMGNEQ